MTTADEVYEKYLNNPLSHFISMLIILILDSFLLLLSLVIIKIIDIGACILGLQNDSAILVVNYFIHPLLIIILGILLILNVFGQYFRRPPPQNPPKSPTTPPGPPPEIELIVKDEDEKMFQ